MSLPAGLIPMCCWPSSTKLPMGWPSGLYAAPWLTEGSRRKPDCSQNVAGGEKKRRHTRQWANIPALAQTHYKTLWYMSQRFSMQTCRASWGHICACLQEKGKLNSDPLKWKQTASNLSKKAGSSNPHILRFCYITKISCCYYERLCVFSRTYREVVSQAVFGKFADCNMQNI